MSARKTIRGETTLDDGWGEPDGTRIRLSAFLVWLAAVLFFVGLASLS